MTRLNAALAAIRAEIQQSARDVTHRLALLRGMQRHQKLRIPRSVPDEQFSELFARLGSHRDRALAAFWVSTGARVAELLNLDFESVCQNDW
jgi:site-specific recombinase XerC